MEVVFCKLDKTEFLEVFFTNITISKSKRMGLNLKVSIIVIYVRLCSVVNDSLSSLVFSGNSERCLKCSEYRPILVLTVLSKRFERVVYERICQFMQANNL